MAVVVGFGEVSKIKLDMQYKGPFCVACHSATGLSGCKSSISSWLILFRENLCLEIPRTKTSEMCDYSLLTSIAHCELL